MPKYLVDTLSGLFLILLSIMLLGQLRNIPVEGAILPQVTIYTLILFSSVLAIQAIIKREKEKINFVDDLDGVQFTSTAIVYAISIYACLTFSFLSSLFLMNIIIVVSLAEHKNIKSLISAVIFAALMTTFIYLFFTKLMNIYFPENIFV